MVGVAMAAASALDRGGTLLDRALIVAIACVMVLGAHLLPALSRSAMARGLWVGCLLLTAWGHATFFVAAGHRSGTVRAEAVVQTGQARAIQAELDGIQARAVAVVSSDLAVAQARISAETLVLERCQRSGSSEQPCQRSRQAIEVARLRTAALGDELTEARRAARLRERLVEVAGEQDQAKADVTADPIAQSVAGLLGLSAEAISMSVSLLSALVVELMAALLWSIGLQREVVVGAGSDDDSVRQSQSSDGFTTSGRADASVVWS
jgi:hypothetical protein